MTEEFLRTGMLFGKENMERLAAARVAVFGIGGVGGYVVEALARSGIGTLDLIDNDIVAASNMNRQIIALHSTIGRYKVDAARDRILDINPRAVVNCHKTFYMPDTAQQFDFRKYDYIVDAIDTVTGKLELAAQAERAGTRIISSMGAGNKTDPTAFEVADIYETSVCPLAKVMRRELKKRNISHLKVVYSREKAMTPLTMQEAYDGKKKKIYGSPEEDNNAADRPVRRQTPGSNAFVPPVAGLIIAGEVVRDLCDPGKMAGRTV